MKKRLGYYPSLVCSDRGGEFTGRGLVKFLEDRHIKTLVSEPYHPEHNGRAERANRTILESMRAVVSSSNIKKSHWHEILKSSCLARNQIPRKGETNSPWSLMHNYDLPNTYLKPVGTPVVYLRMRQEKGAKFKQKGREGILIGFNTPLLHYQILTTEGTVINTKHVRFLHKNTQMTSSLNLGLEDWLDFERNPRAKTASSEEISSSGITRDPIDHTITQPDHSEPHFERLEEQPTLPFPDTQNQEPNPPNWGPRLRDRSLLKPPTRYGFHHHFEPKTYDSEIRCDDSRLWKDAIEQEVNSIKNHGVWEDFYDTPPNPLKTTWVFKTKENFHGDPLPFKGILCVQGFDQIRGTDFEETFAPAGKVATLRALLLYSLHKDLPVR